MTAEIGESRVVMIILFLIAIIFIIWVISEIDGSSNSSSSSTYTKSKPSPIQPSTSSNRRTDLCTTAQSSATFMSEAVKSVPLTAKLDLANLFCDDKELKILKECYIKRNVQLKIDVPTFNVYSLDHKLIGVVGLNDTEPIHTKAEKNKAYKATVTKKVSNKLELSISFDEPMPVHEVAFSFEYPNCQISESKVNQWFDQLQQLDLDEEEKFALAYLGPNWQKSQQSCIQCGEFLHEIETAEEVRIVVGKNDKQKFTHFTTCMTCERIMADKNVWQAESEVDYSLRINYLAMCS